jgi:hypothetical protein
VLRTYALLKYGDGSEQDWFTFYVEVAGAQAKGQVKMLERIVRDGAKSAAILALLVTDAWPPVVAAARNRVLAAPPGAAV